MLKLKSFTVHKKVPDSVFTDKNGQEEIARILGALVGFVSCTVVDDMCCG